MGHEGDLFDAVVAIKLFKPGIAVRVHPAFVFAEVILGMRSAPVFGELIPGGGWHIAGLGAFIAGIDPEPPGLRLAGAWSEHVDRCVIGEDRFAFAS